MRLAFYLLMFLGVAQHTSAGAWSREKGELFIATGGNFWLSDGAQLPVHYDPTLYAEFGASENMAIGLEIYTADAGRVASGLAYASFPLGDQTARDKFSAGFAMGLRADGYHQPETLVRGQFAWGRGLQDGWLAADVNVTYGIRKSTFRTKMDVTWGHNWTEHWTTTVQLQTGQGITNDIYAKVVPSLVYRWNDSMNFQIGYVKAFTGDRGSGLKFETWLTY